MMDTTDIAVAVKRNPLEALVEAVSKLPTPVRFRSENERILVKPSIYDPNLVGNNSLEMMSSVVSIFEEIAELVIIESDNPKRNAQEAFEGMGYLEALSGRVKFENLSMSDLKSVKFPGHHLQDRKMPELLTESSFLVNLATLKATPNPTSISGCLKNLFGLLPEKDKSVFHEDIDAVLLDLLSQFYPDLTIADLTQVAVGAREENNARFVGGVVVGEDPVAIDAYLAFLLGKNPMEIPLLTKAQDAGLGQATMDTISVHGTLHQKGLLKKRLNDCIMPKGI